MNATSSLHLFRRLRHNLVLVGELFPQTNICDPFFIARYHYFRAFQYGRAGFTARTGNAASALLQKNKIVGTGGLELFNQCALIRSITVETGSRGKGLGKLISRELEKICRERGIDWVYLLTTTAKDFFINQGYRVISREEVPLPIKTTSEFSSVCPSSAIVMAKSLA